MRTSLLCLALIACNPSEPDDTVSPGSAAVCGVSTDLLDAPPSAESAAGLLAPVDLRHVATNATASPEGRITFETVFSFFVGDAVGLPTFDFAPTPIELTLDGEALPTDALTRVGLREPERRVTVLQRDLDPCSEHTMSIRYEVDSDWFHSGDQPRIELLPEGLFWSGGLSDGTADHYVSMWSPANLLFDRFSLELSVELVDEARPHQLVANAPVEELGPHAWRVRYPDTNQAHSPFWVMAPSSMPHHSQVVDLSAGPVTIDVYKRPEDPEDLEAIGARASAALLDFASKMGAYAHGDRYIVWLWHDQNDSMEYGGATITRANALEHELLHSWWARGVTPMSDHDGWFDEAITQWGSGPSPFYAAPAPPLEHVTMVIGEDEWAAANLNPLHYALGASVFAAIADHHGLDATLAALRAFYEERAIGPARTQDLEDHLYCWFSEDVFVTELFYTHVWGGELPAPARPADTCGVLE